MNIYKDTPISDIKQDSFKREPLVELIVESSNSSVSSMKMICCGFVLGLSWGGTILKFNTM